MSAMQKSLDEIRKYMTGDESLPPVRRWSWNGVAMTAASDALKMVNPALGQAVATAQVAVDPKGTAKSSASWGAILADPLAYVKGAALNVLFLGAGALIIFFYVKKQAEK